MHLISEKKKEIQIKSTGKLDVGRETKKHRLREVKCFIATTKRVTLHQNTASSTHTASADSTATKNVWANVNVWTKRLCSCPHVRNSPVSERRRTGRRNMSWPWRNRSGIKVTVRLHMGPLKTSWIFNEVQKQGFHFGHFTRWPRRKNLGGCPVFFRKI